jgi:hypothetical protein
MPPESVDRASPPGAVVRRILLAIFLIGAIGTGAELLLLEHTEQWQLVPLVLIAIGLFVLGWLAVSRRRAALRVFQATMVAFLVSGAAGLALHYRGNVEFELEMYPSLGGTGLFWKALTGATPALAPGTMIQLGLIGLTFTYRHPALER